VDPSSVIAQMRTPPAINPRDYHSPSGEFVLNVDPTDLYARGEGNYRVTRKGTVVWSGAKPFTLYEAGITDVGIIAGYAYSQGVEGFPRERGRDRPGMFHVVIMRPNGELLLNEITVRTESRFLHTRPDPVARGILVDGDKDQFTLLIRDADLNRREDSWWTYQLSTGKAVGKPNAGPKIPPVLWDAETVEGVEKAKATELPVFPDGSLKQLGRFSFGREQTTASAIRDIACFDFDDRGRIGFIRREARDHCTFVYLSEDGRVLNELPLAIPTTLFTNDFPKTAWVENDRWVVVLSNRREGGKAFAWWLQTSDGRFDSISNFDSPPIEHLAGSRDGGFLALTTTYLKYSMEDNLIAFDRTGKSRWQIKQDYSADEGALFSPEDVTVTTSGRVAVVDNIRHTVQFFESNGDFLSVLKLEELWGRRPNYPTDISADTNGGVLVKDFNGNPPAIRMASNGKVIGQFVPKHADGRIIDAIRGFKVAPSGRVWACDGECFVRLRNDGTSDAVIGNPPAAEALGRIAGLTVDQQGRLYAADERTGAVHVFDQSGKLLRICKPEVSDFDGKLSLANVAAAPDGTVYLSDRVSRNNDDGPRYLQFGADGRRLGIKKLGLDNVSEDWHPLLGGEKMLVLGYQEAFLVDQTAKVTRTIQRRPDRNWLEFTDGASVAPDGAFAILTGGRHWQRKSWQVNLYNPSGEPVRTLTMSTAFIENCFAYTGKYLATRTASEICLFKSTGEPLVKFTPEIDGFTDTNQWWNCFATLEGRELWFVSTKSKSVWRFELPL
jgi:sugar lactone lactonase YvrE